MGSSYRWSSFRPSLLGSIHWGASIGAGCIAISGILKMMLGVTIAIAYLVLIRIDEAPPLSAIAPACRSRVCCGGGCGDWRGVPCSSWFYPHLLGVDAEIGLATPWFGALAFLPCISSVCSV